MDAIIQGLVLTLMEVLKGAKLFPSMMEKLCLKYIPTFAWFPEKKSQVEYETRLCNKVITFHQNKGDATTVNKPCKIETYVVIDDPFTKRKQTVLGVASKQTRPRIRN